MVYCLSCALFEEEFFSSLFSSQERLCFTNLASSSDEGVAPAKYPTAVIAQGYLTNQLRMTLQLEGQD